jgi:hypothetical protein
VAKQTFQLARCGCTLRVTSQTSYSPEYITPTHKIWFYSYWKNIPHAVHKIFLKIDSKLSKLKSTDLNFSILQIYYNIYILKKKNYIIIYLSDQKA